MVNPAYTRITGIPREKVIGKNIFEHRKNPLLPEIMKKKTPVDGIGRKIGQKQFYVSMAPIIADGEVIAGVTVLKDLDVVRQKIDEYSRKLKRMQNKIRSSHVANFTFKDIVAQSQIMKETIELARKIAHKNMNVLLLGESGTGKEIFAQAIHNDSSRSSQPFVTVNCPCLPPNLLESELFGHEEGAFSGAVKGGKLGLYEIADGGTIFLDEIGDLDLEIQAKILRVLETGQFLRVGGTKPVTVNVRTIAATNRNLEKMVKEGKFREDLYYRLNVVPLFIPPLRERAEDISLLAEHFLSKINNDQKTNQKFHQETLEIFNRYSWPGNVRELYNTVIAMSNFTDSDLLLPRHLPDRFICPRIPNHEIQKNEIPSKENHNIRAIESQLIATCLKKYGTSVQAKKRIAKEMGISLATLYNKIRRYGLSKN